MGLEKLFCFMIVIFEFKSGVVIKMWLILFLGIVFFCVGREKNVWIKIKYYEIKFYLF